MISKKWCLGFMFSSDLRQVVLIKKSRTLHVGKLNGVGGTVEKDESPWRAMIRECKEETGYGSQPSDWVDVGVLDGEDWRVVVYALRMPSRFDSFLSVPDSKDDTAPMKYYLVTLADLDLAPHTGALIFASLEKLRDPTVCSVKLEEVIS